MKLDEDQLEWIVREVVRRLQETPRSPLHSEQERGEGLGARGAPHSTSPQATAHLTLTQTLITTETLENQLQGATQITVPARAVVTPAARDLLKERNIQLIRAY